MHGVSYKVLAVGLLILAGGTFAVPALARTSCHVGGGYLVIQKERAEDVGSDFLIRRSQGGVSPKKCAFSPKAGDIRLPASPETENAWYFLAVAGTRMALDDGTGAQNRSLVVVDLRTGKIAGSFETFETARVENGIAYVTIPGKRGTREVCPNLAADLISHARMVSETAIDLADLKASPTGMTKCVYEE